MEEGGEHQKEPCRNSAADILWLATNEGLDGWRDGQADGVMYKRDIGKGMKRTD